MNVEVVPQGGLVITHVEVLDGSVSLAIPRSPDPAIDLRANNGVTITGAVAGPIRELPKR